MNGGLTNDARRSQVLVVTLQGGRGVFPGGSQPRTSGARTPMVCLGIGAPGAIKTRFPDYRLLPFHSSIIFTKSLNK